MTTTMQKLIIIQFKLSDIEIQSTGVWGLIVCFWFF